MRPQPISPIRMSELLDMVSQGEVQLGGREVAPELVVQRTALRALREQLPRLQRLPEGAVGVVVPDPAERLLAHVAELDVDRARVHVAVRIDARGLPRVEALLDEGVLRILEAPPDLLLRLERGAERDRDLVLLALGLGALHLLPEEVGVAL